MKIVILLFTLVASCIQATTYYAATNGSSANTGLSTNSPWEINYAITKLGPGFQQIYQPASDPIGH
jgi:hypothetical protein